MLRKLELSAGLMGYLARKQTLPTYLLCQGIEKITEIISLSLVDVQWCNTDQKIGHFRVAVAIADLLSVSK